MVERGIGYELIKRLRISEEKKINDNLGDRRKPLAGRFRYYNVAVGRPVEFRFPYFGRIPSAGGHVFFFSGLTKAVAGTR